MRILLASAHGPDPAYGGAERYVLDLARGLTARGHEATILSAFPQRADSGIPVQVLHGSDWRDSELRRLRNHAGDVISAPLPSFERLVRAARPHLVHTSNLPGFGSGIWESARRLGVPVLHTLHDYHLLCPRTTLTRRDGSPCRPHPLLCGARTRRLRRWAGAVSHVIGGSEHVLKAHEGFFPTGSRHVVRLPLLPLEAGRATPPGDVLRTIGYIGALAPMKGIEVLLAAAPELARLGVEVRIAGSGPLEDVVEDSPARYVGRVGGAEKAAFLTSCDAGVSPSLWEEPGGPTYAVCEWLGAGRPVMVTRRGGLREAARGGAVLAFDPSPEGLVRAARELRDPAEWNRALAAAPPVEDDADVRRWLAEHEEIYAIAAAGAEVPP